MKHQRQRRRKGEKGRCTLGVKEEGRTCWERKNCFGAKNGGSMPGMKAKMGVKGKAGRILGFKEGGTNKRSH